MTDRYHDLLFTPAVRAAQAQVNGRAFSPPPGEGPDALGQDEAAFIASRESFYMASVSASGWPYVQHRGGPPGFIQALDPRRLAFVDLKGNRQLITLGNLAGEDRVALFFMDYARQGRLKLLARARPTPLESEPELAAALAPGPLREKAQRLMILEVEAFDWNCNQHITPRFTQAELAPTLRRLQSRIEELEGRLAALGETP
ncbi:pyridoxamine 5'-phosphate oxidase family protein [Albimonas sp. CAU 1670]|uniref:pyridoxamine 5'-phosphate oxidase family protein n=1 Tax=Albimonas sp. CAU 1670 TaxID=3032599 RepID=UPI0023D9A7AD|nr:pyridoxamine 5'-phosphate oxidase family protein [Albimonas sp. CAU 1670]MDF2231077.1 pyridoxamine 5'-phosphate oxidase family protein [Albimonas sp. CAU 1670]